MTTAAQHRWMGMPLHALDTVELLAIRDTLEEVAFGATTSSRSEDDRVAVMQCVALLDAQLDEFRALNARVRW